MSFDKESQSNCKRLICLLCALLLFFFGVFFVTDAYARYISSYSANKRAETAKWSVALKKGSDTLSQSFDAVFTAVGENPHIGPDKFAPSSSMQATFVLDLAGTEVAVDYEIRVDAGVLRHKIQSGDITLDVYDNDGATPVTLGKETCIPLPEGKAFTSENGIHTFKFVLSWIKDGDDFSDVGLALNNASLSLPVSIKLRQHTEGGGDRMVSSDISFFETVESKKRNVLLGDYPSFDRQDILADNSERGFYSTSQLVLTKDGRDESVLTATSSNVSKLLNLKVDLSAFSGAMNGTGDEELTQAALTALENILEQIKQNDNTVILRFVYDNFASGLTDPKVDGKTKLEPAQDMLLKHISALGSTFKRYASTINVIQAGFYGLWGECYYMTDADENGATYYPATVDALLTATAGTEINIAVRTVKYYSWAENGTTLGADAFGRVGIFNDAYGVDETDMGTYGDRNTDTNWLKGKSANTYYGGEALPDQDNLGFGTYNAPEYFVNEAYKLHTSYLNWEWDQRLHTAWAKTGFMGKDRAYDNSALAYIESRLGYRFVVEDVKTYKTVQSGETLPIEITVRNVGFANLVKSKRCDIVIWNNSKGYLETEFPGVPIDARDFISQTSVTSLISVNLPALEKGSYSVYLRVSSGETLTGGFYYSAVRFANDDMWNSRLKANRIAEFEVQ